jgi:acetate kinase
MKVLVLNLGSSSVKYRVFIMPGGRLLAKGLVEKIGERNSSVQTHEQALKKILQGESGIQAIGHRVVHGGERFRAPHIITSSVMKEIERLGSLAPLHNPINLIGIKVCAKLLAHIPQVAVFDTAFHQGMPEHAYLYALPYAYYRKFGIRRYGFHGTSHEYVSREAARILKKPLSSLRLITCHLGNGCSISAVAGGHSIETSMGFTPLEGLVMGTRCGDIDPALIFYLKDKLHISFQALENILNKESGLKGLTGISNDFRDIKKAAKAGSNRSRLALEVFTYRLAKYIGAYFAVLGRADAIVFTGGIGENNPELIRQATKNLKPYLKLAKTRILVIRTNEELLIARKTYELVK